MSKGGQGEGPGCHPLLLQSFHDMEQARQYVRRAKNNLHIAEEQYAEKQTELEVLRRQAELDVAAYRKETEQAERKVAADSIAFQLVRQRYVAGLALPLDLQTSATTLLQARAAQLQARLMVGVKELTTRY